MPIITAERVREYLERLVGKPVCILSMGGHDKQELAGDLKAFGYGTPVFIEYESDGERKQAVLETLSRSTFGHDHFSDRAQSILWEHSCFNDLPHHVRSLDSGAFLRSGSIISTGCAEEFFLLTEFVPGQGYFRDIDRIRACGSADDLDIQRTSALSNYLADIHATKNSETALYTRRIRELLGHGECIMGLIDNYPDRYEFIDRSLLKQVESACVDWRWKIKDRAYRLSQVHGDFHPWNILFREGCDFTLLDRSRGAWGEPADDVTCMTINYIFASLLRYGRLEGPFEKIFMLFWDNYLKRTNDLELLAVAAPFFAWRGLVVASPVWYPSLPVAVRRSIFNFIVNVLSLDSFDPSAVNRYLQ